MSAVWKAELILIQDKPSCLAVLKGPDMVNMSVLVIGSYRQIWFTAACVTSCRNCSCYMYGM